MVKLMNIIIMIYIYVDLVQTLTHIHT